MQLQAIQIDKSLLIIIKGKILLRECRTLKDTVLARLNPTIDNVYINLQEVDFIDSAGLGVMVGIKMSANKYSAVTYLIGPRPEVKSLFTVAKLDSIFKIVVDYQALPDQEFFVKAKQKLENETAAFDVSSSSSEKGARVVTAEFPQVEDDSHLGLFQDKGSQNKESSEGESKKATIQSKCKEALSCFNHGKLQDAIDLFKEALRIDPTYLPARNNLAMLYEKNPKWYRRALDEWEMVLTLADELNEAKYHDRAAKKIRILKKKIT